MILRVDLKTAVGDDRQPTTMLHCPCNNNNNFTSTKIVTRKSIWKRKCIETRGNEIAVLHAAVTQTRHMKHSVAIAIMCGVHWERAMCGRAYSHRHTNRQWSTCPTHTHAPCILYAIEYDGNNCVSCLSSFRFVVFFLQPNSIHTDTVFTHISLRHEGAYLPADTCKAILM